MKLLKTLCKVHAPSGNEIAIKKFILNYIHENQNNWKVKPEIIIGDEILSGKRKDKHLTHLIETLKKHNFHISRADYISDDTAEIKKTLEDNGFSNINIINMTFGISSIFSGKKNEQ